MWLTIHYRRAECSVLSVADHSLEESREQIGLVRPMRGGGNPMGAVLP